MSESEEILIVEDDEAIATGIAMNLRLEGYVPTVTCDGEEAADLLASRSFDLVMLDIGLPKKSGLDVLRGLRETDHATPVIILSAREHEYDKVAALRLGADDYVTKPFALAELLARVHAVLRRSNLAKNGAADDRVVAFADVSVNLDKRTVTKRGEPVRLTHLEFELLRFFLAHPDRVIGRNELLEQVWGVKHGGSRRTVDNFVGQLRSKLEDDPEAPRFLLTVRGAGYRFEQG